MGSPDTGAREPQDSVSAPAKERQDAREGHERSCASLVRLPDPGPEGKGTFDERGWYHAPCDCGVSRRRERDLYDRRYPTGLAGVGEARPAEPPQEDLVGAAENAARETTSRHTQACQPGLGPKRSPAGERATGASKPSIGTAKPTNRTSSSAGENAPVGAPAEEQPDARAPRYISTAQKVVELQAECGQLREALDEALSYRRTGRMPQEVLERLRAVSVSALRKERGDARGRAEAWAAHVRREAALTRERDGLREQLDAARQALDAVAGDIDRLPTNFGRDTLRKLVGIRDRARAALGDVAAGAEDSND